MSETTFKCNLCGVLDDDNTQVRGVVFDIAGDLSIGNSSATTTHLCTDCIKAVSKLNKTLS